MPIANNVFKTHAPVAYNEMRGRLQNGDILLCSGTEIFSRLIQTATLSKWSHVGFIWRLEEIDRVMILESVQAAGVRVMPLSTLVDGNRRRKPYPGRLAVARHGQFGTLASVEKMRTMTQFALDRMASNYAAGEVVKIVGRIMLGTMRIRLPGVLRSSDEYICSEYAYQCYKTIGIDIPSHPAGFVAPSDFARCAEVDLVGVLKTKGSPKRIREPKPKEAVSTTIATHARAA